MANRNIQNQRPAVNQIVEGDENYIRVIFSIITIWDETIYQNQINNNIGIHDGDNNFGNQNIDAGGDNNIGNQNIDDDQIRDDQIVDDIEEHYPSVLAVYNHVNYRENGLPSIDRYGNVLPYIPLDIIRDIVEDRVVQRI